MVLTRASYSKSGTPLASPLINPERTSQRRNSRGRGSQPIHSADVSITSFTCSPDTTLSFQTPMKSTPKDSEEPRETNEKETETSSSQDTINHIFEKQPETSSSQDATNHIPEIKSEISFFQGTSTHISEDKPEISFSQDLTNQTSQEQPETSSTENNPEISFSQDPTNQISQEQPETSSTQDTTGHMSENKPEISFSQDLTNQTSQEQPETSSTQDTISHMSENKPEISFYQDPTNQTSQKQPETSSTQDTTSHMSEKDEDGDHKVHESAQEDPPSRSSSRTAVDTQDQCQPNDQQFPSEEAVEITTPSDESGSDSKSTGESSAGEEDEEEETTLQHIPDHSKLDQTTLYHTTLDHHDHPSELNSSLHESDDEKIKEILEKAKLKGRSFENQTQSIEGLVTRGEQGLASSDCASSITFGKNWIKLDDQQENNTGKLRNGSSLLSKPIKICDIEKKLFKDHLKAIPNSSYSTLKSHRLQSTSSLAPRSLETIQETNFDRVLEIKQRQLGFSGSTSKLNHHNQSMDWHDLPVQTLTKEVKMEIQAMRLHRTLDPKSFIKGGIEKATKEPIPNKFLFGYVTGGDGSIDGSISKSTPSIKKRSFVETLLQDDKSQEWSKKKYNEVQSSGRSGKHTKKSFKKRH